MGVMSDLDFQLQQIRRVMEDDMGDEPQTPREQAQYKVEMAARDAWLATSELVKLRADPIAGQFFDGKVEGDLWSIKARVDLLVSELREAVLPPSNVRELRRG
jgi:hypothetical protein